MSERDPRHPPVVLIGDPSPPPSVRSVGEGFFDRRVADVLLGQGIAVERGKDFADVLAGCELEAPWPEELVEAATELLRLVVGGGAQPGEDDDGGADIGDGGADARGVETSEPDGGSV